jgi:formyl-CoA transferase
MGDHPTGVSLFAAIATALYRRERTGRGGHVETSLLANGFWSNGCLGQAALAGLDFADRRAGVANPDAPPPATHVLYETSDGRYLQLNMVRSTEHEEAMLRIFGLGRLLEDPAFATQEDRAENAAALADQLRPAIQRHTLDHWLSQLGAASVPASYVRYAEEMADDQQAIDNRILLRCQDPEVGMPLVINHPVGLSDVQGHGAVRPPEVGEHSAEVLTELGYDREEIEAMRRDGVF